MYSRVVYCLLLIFFTSNAGGGLLMSSCNTGGFTCKLNQKTKSQLITFRCPATTKEVSFVINHFNSPTNTEALVIENCDKVAISTKCTSVFRNIQSLEIKNVKQLIIERSEYKAHLPPMVSIENVGYLETIPSFSFAQIETGLHSAGCIIPKTDFESISLRNVTIGTIQPNAIVLANNSNNVNFDNVKINRLQHSAINVKMRSNATFSITNSTVDVVEHLSFQFVGENARFVANEFVDIASSGINGTLGNFVFVDNKVNTLQSHSISILAENVNITNNTFEYLKTGAFEMIGPGLLRDSGTNFAKLKFVYNFVHNLIGHTDVASLHPDMVSYNNVANEIAAEKNNMNCFCENLGWLFSEIDYGYKASSVSSFYSFILDNYYENNCTGTTCHLAVSMLKKTIKDGKCVEDFNVNDLCIEHTTTTLPASSELSIHVARKPPTSKSAPRLFQLRASSRVNLVSNVLMMILVFCLVVN